MSTLESAVQLHLAGRLAEAEAAYRDVLGREPNNATAQNNLGSALLAQGRRDEALACFRRAAALQPGYRDAQLNLARILFESGNALAARGEHDDAASRFEEILAFQPELPEVQSNLGLAYRALGRLDEAIAAYRRALALRPEFAAAHCNLGAALNEQGKSDEAVACYARALALEPGLAEAHCNLGNALIDLGRPEEALASLERAVALRPDYPEAQSNRGRALATLGRVEEADACFRQVLRGAPDAVTAARTRFSHGVLMLLRGDYAAGLPLYEGRFEAGALPAAYAPMRARAKEMRGVPRWQGEDLRGKSLLVWTDQGLGDSLMAMRFLFGLKRRGAGRLMVYCEPRLSRAMKTVAEVDEVIPRDRPAPRGGFERQCPIMSLPLLCGARLETLPGASPYLRVPEPLRAEWEKKFAGVAPLKVGLSWAGGVLTASHAARNVRLERLAPLRGVPGIQFVSLQMGEPAAELAAAGWPMLDRNAECSDLLDTAALIEQLDLVISVDTAVAHAAGALGKPVWLLNRFESEWRWMLGREDTPWYPSMRIFRQRRSGDWDEVAVRLAAALRGRARRAT